MIIQPTGCDVRRAGFLRFLGRYIAVWTFILGAVVGVAILSLGTYGILWAVWQPDCTLDEYWEKKDGDE